MSDSVPTAFHDRDENRRRFFDVSVLRKSADERAGEELPQLRQGLCAKRASQPRKKCLVDADTVMNKTKVAADDDKDDEECLKVQLCFLFRVLPLCFMFNSETMIDSFLGELSCHYVC